jgi:hypothetical protein
MGRPVDLVIADVPMVAAPTRNSPSRAGMLCALAYRSSRAGELSSESGGGESTQSIHSCSSLKGKTHEQAHLHHRRSRRHHRRPVIFWFALIRCRHRTSEIRPTPRCREGVDSSMPGRPLPRARRSPIVAFINARSARHETLSEAQQPQTIAPLRFGRIGFLTVEG